MLKSRANFFQQDLEIRKKKRLASDKTDRLRTGPARSLTRPLLDPAVVLSTFIGQEKDNGFVIGDIHDSEATDSLSNFLFLVP